jgi:branched-chain amino acid transport system substrate-binding protein
MPRCLQQKRLKQHKAIHGVADITPAMMRDGMEALEMSEEKMASLGLPGFGPSFNVSCDNHGGPGLVGVTQWDASSKTWSLISDFAASDSDVINPLIAEDSGAYAAENNITEGCN